MTITASNRQIPSTGTITHRPVVRSTPTARWALTRTVVLATVLAGAATETFTALVRAAGVRLAVDDPTGHAGTPIGFGACVIMIALCMVAGLALAALVRRRAVRPVRTWYVATGVLTALSLIPDLTEPSTSAATRVTLMTAHVIAAAVIVPMIARRLRAGR